MELTQTVRLSADEIKRAIQWYVARKNTGAEPRDFDCALHFRSRHGPYAVVKVLRPAIPVLTDNVPEEQL